MSVRILGIDYGEKRVGLALSDPLGITAQPLECIGRENDAQVAGEIERLIQIHNIKQVVVGMPIHLSGKDSSQTKRIRRFILKLRKILGTKIEAWDERMSSAEAERALIDMDVRRSRRKEIRDIMAAQFILQGYLDTKGPAKAPLP